MSTTTDKKIILSKCPLAWLYKIDESADTLTLAYKFDNLSDVVIKMLIAGSAAGGENTDFTRADGAIVRFPKESLILDGATELQVASDSGGADASGLGEITITTNEADVASTSWTAFCANLNLNKDAKYLLIVGTGFSYNRTGTGSTRKPDGYAFMIGKITSDIEVTSVPLTITFAAQKASGFTMLVAALNTTIGANSIALKRGGASYDATITPKSLPATDETAVDSLKKGEIVLVAEAA